MLCSMLVIQGVPWLTTVFLFTKRGPFDFWPEVLLVRFYELEDSVGQRVYVDMLVFGMYPWGFKYPWGLATEIQFGKRRLDVIN